MNKAELIRELRELTQAGMNDCKEALEQSDNDLQKAVDYIKTKGLNIADGRSGRAASEGVVAIANADSRVAVMMEVNCQTDFVAKSPSFEEFADDATDVLYQKVKNDDVFQVSDVEDKRKALVAITKENVVVRRWWAEQALSPLAKVFAYLHSNNKIGVLLTLLASSEEAVNSLSFKELGENLAMQVAAMAPLAVEAERLNAEDVARQQAIFQQQLTDLKKPQGAWPKILEGKTRKWHTEVCLLEQESIWVPKQTVKQLVAKAGTDLGGEIKIVNFIRCQVGEGIESKKDDLGEEVNKLMVDQAYGSDIRK